MKPLHGLSLSQNFIMELYLRVFKHIFFNLPPHVLAKLEGKNPTPKQEDSLNDNSTQSVNTVQNSLPEEINTVEPITGTTNISSTTISTQSNNNNDTSKYGGFYSMLMRIFYTKII